MFDACPALRLLTGDALFAQRPLAALIIPRRRHYLPAIKHILPQLLTHGRVVRGYLGLHARNVPLPPNLARRFELTQTGAVEVIAIEPGGPADQAGILEEDLIVSLGEQPTTCVDDLHKLLTQLPIDVPAPVTLLHGERRLNRLVLPTEYPMQA